MSNPMLAAMGLGNLYVSFNYFRVGDLGLALTFFSYFVACFGFIWHNLEMPS